MKKEQDGEPVVLRDGERFSGALTSGEWKKSSVSRGADWDHAHCISASLLRLSLHRAGFAGSQPVLQTICEKKAEPDMKK